LDYKKAFDSVPHRRLIEKLKTFGITGKVLKWLESFLSARTMRVGLRGTYSDEVPVISGVPQGSVIGPLLFILYVNELPDWIKNEMKMFADDTKIWCKIKTEKDGESLQKDLNELMDWSDKWQLSFNSEKCKVMHIGHKQGTRYYMSKELETIKEEKDLGVSITSDLKPSRQCQKSAAKARGIIGMVRRNFRRLTRRDFRLIYKTYVRPHLEYCIQAWSPHLRKDIELLERVQRSATELVPDLRGFTYEVRLQKLGLTTLEVRRERGDMIETYKILSGKENVKKQQFFKLAENEHGLRGHDLKLEKVRSRLDVRKFWFSQRIVNGWNRLPMEVVHAETVNGFKNAWDRQRKEMDAKSY
jgi:ribonucleases P/MRP protein subunit RPP40